MSLRDIKTMIVAGFKSAFLPFHVKQAYLRRVTEELERFTPDGQIKPMPAPSSGRGFDPSPGRRADPPRPTLTFTDVPPSSRDSAN
jgi:adenosine deaminase